MEGMTFELELGFLFYKILFEREKAQHAHMREGKEQRERERISG